jgi:sulfur relay (sulfurtransferase) DsrC/TusE family protein
MEDNKVITQMAEGFLRYIADNKDSIQVLISENGGSNFQKKHFGLVQEWLKNNMDIPLPEMVKMMVKLTKR